jgi:tetratricopeptide (TPR) repeat protein
MADLKAIYKRAFEAFSREDYDLAVEEYGKLISEDPGFVLAYQGLAEVWSRKDELERAIDAIDKAIELDPSESLYHTSKSRFLQRQGKIPEAEEEAAIAMRLQSH